MPNASAARSAAATAIRRPSLAAVISGISGDGAPGFRRSRSVGQVGNQMATTRRIERLHDPGMRLAAATPERRQAPARAAQTRGLRSVRQRRAGRHRGHPPACYGGARLQQDRVVETPAAPQQERRDAGLLGRQIAAGATQSAPTRR